MIDYVDPVPYLVDYLDKFFQESEVTVVGGEIPPDIPGIVLGVRHAGGPSYGPEPYTRVRLLARADVDYEAFDALTAASNELERYGHQVQGVRVLRIMVESRPVPSVDDDTDQPEAWQYIAVKHLEA